MNKILDTQLVEKLIQNEITEFSELEQLCIPKLKSGRDLICAAANGSGKTFTIVVGILQQLKKPIGDNPRAVIVVPDVDRALKMKNEFLRFGKHTNLRIHTACENEKIDDQKDQIYMGSDVVIGTIKRLNQIYSLYALNLSSMKIFVIDDADEIIRGMNYPQFIRLSEAPAKSQHVVFASQINEWIERFAEETMNVQEIIEFDDEIQESE